MKTHGNHHSTKTKQKQSERKTNHSFRRYEKTWKIMEFTMLKITVLSETIWMVKSCEYISAEFGTLRSTKTPFGRAPCLLYILNNDKWNGFMRTI